jgi:hypothetical protein
MRLKRVPWYRKNSAVSGANLIHLSSFSIALSISPFSHATGLSALAEHNCWEFVSVYYLRQSFLLQCLLPKSLPNFQNVLVRRVEQI